MRVETHEVERCLFLGNTVQNLIVGEREKDAVEGVR